MNIIDHGVCRLSVVPIRQNPTHQSEQVTQLLFGEHYQVINNETSGKWMRIRTEFDQYEGWLDSRQHHAVTHEYFDYINRTEFKITMDITASILYNKSRQIILMGSMIPISSSELFKMEEQFAFNGEAKNLGQKRNYEFLKGIAFKYLNAPYNWGGKSPFGIDCSGFTQMTFKICGYKLLRDSGLQANQGKSIKISEGYQPGDLAFFKDHEGKIIHVGIVLEDNKIIHAHGQVRVDHLNEEGILNMETKIYSHTLSHFRRILTD